LEEVYLIFIPVIIFVFRENWKIVQKTISEIFLVIMAPILWNDSFANSGECEISSHSCFPAQMFELFL
jgi:hypothetical protein